MHSYTHTHCMHVIHRRTPCMRDICRQNTHTHTHTPTHTHTHTHKLLQETTRYYYCITSTYEQMLHSLKQQISLSQETTRYAGPTSRYSTRSKMAIFPYPAPDVFKHQVCTQTHRQTDRHTHTQPHVCIYIYVYTHTYIYVCI